MGAAAGGHATASPWKPRGAGNSKATYALLCLAALLLLLHVLRAPSPGTRCHYSSRGGLQRAERPAGPAVGGADAAGGSAAAAAAGDTAPAAGGGASTGAGASSVRLFVGVLSRSNNSAVRDAIRDTWGSDARLARVMFVVLRPASADAFRALRQEAVQHGDLVVVSAVKEDYYAITHSTLELFRAAAVLAPSLSHVLKTDEDCYVRVPQMLDALAAAPRAWMYGGNPMGTGDLLSRDPKDKARHYVPYSNWASDAPLPTYAWGHGAVLSIDLVAHIAAGAAHLTMPPHNLLVLEDVATGIWVQAVGHEQGRAIAYTRLPFNRTACRPGDALTHLDRAIFPSLAEAHRCIFAGRCCTDEEA